MHRAIREARQILIEAMLDYLCANAQVEILGISKRAPTLNTRELQFQTV